MAERELHRINENVERDNLSEISSHSLSSVVDAVPPTKYPMSYLSSLIPSGFNGDRKLLNKFIVSCNLAFSLAIPSQETPLLYYVITKLEDPALTQLMHAEINNWKDLKTKLNALYRNKKQYTQLFEELNNLKQGIREPIVKFFARIEYVIAETINEIKRIEENKNLIPGALNNIEMIALSRFLYHSHPEISRVLRITKPKNLQEAYTTAIEEEKSLNYLASQNSYKKPENCYNENSYNRRNNFNQGNNNFQNRNQNFNQNFPNKNNFPERSNFRTNNDKNCLSCGKFGHFAKDCYKNRAQNFMTKSCNYCKKDGHTVDQCFKLMYQYNSPTTLNYNQDNENPNKEGFNPFETSDATYNLNCSALPTSECPLWSQEISDLEASN